MKKHTFLIGAHMSIAGGFYKAFERAEQLDATCMQIFTKSNRQWHAKPIEQEQIEKFKEKQKATGILTVAHSSYLINIGSTQKELHSKSKEALIVELQRCHALGIPYLVLHPGAHGKEDQQTCIDLIATTINAIFAHEQGNTMLLLENTAGQGTGVGYTFEQLATIYKRIKHKKRIGFCLDTCHAFAAGYDFSTSTKYTDFWNTFDKLLGIHKLKAFHFNDSKKDLGCRVDRHADIGKGKIGLEAFKLLCNDKRFYDVPKILETPEDAAGHYHYAENIKLLKELLSTKTKQALHMK